ncbi:MAG TPA: hypothetical protein VE548_15610 [Nitrososphaeraceae archaeon]|nr:hypothetical protein [Nitrososphaeraceae archaeon]
MNQVYSAVTIITAVSMSPASPESAPASLEPPLSSPSPQLPSSLSSVSVSPASASPVSVSPSPMSSVSIGGAGGAGDSRPSVFGSFLHGSSRGLSHPSVFGFSIQGSGGKEISEKHFPNVSS